MIEVPLGMKSASGYHKFYLINHTLNKTPKLEAFGIILMHFEQICIEMKPYIFYHYLMAIKLKS